MSDNISDLQWNINRWYDANVGRWCSDDPIGFEGGDNNLYGYVENVPVTQVDLEGLKLQWHHLLPVQFRDYFANAGLNINDAEYGLLIDDEYHL
jgi:RHS repeat-associated protein